MRFTNVEYSHSGELQQSQIAEETKVEKKPKKIEEEFLIIVDGEEQEALMSYYNDCPAEQLDEVPLKDMIF